MRVRVPPWKVNCDCQSSLVFVLHQNCEPPQLRPLQPRIRFHSACDRAYFLPKVFTRRNYPVVGGITQKAVNTEHEINGRESPASTSIRLGDRNSLNTTHSSVFIPGRKPSSS